MGKKYMIYGFNYPYKMMDAEKQTNWYLIMLFWAAIFIFKYDGIDIKVRK